MGWILGAIGAYLVYQWWQGSQEPAATDAPIPADEGMYEGDGGGGGGGSSGAGDYQAPADEVPPAVVREKASAYVKDRLGRLTPPTATKPDRTEDARQGRPRKPGAPKTPSGVKLAPSRHQGKKATAPARGNRPPKG